MNQQVIVLSMKESTSLLLLWSKGAKRRREILVNIQKAYKKNSPTFISQIAESLSTNSNEKDESISISSIRKHIKVLRSYGLIESINPGGKPELLKLTDEGIKALNQLIHKDDQTKDAGD